MATFSAQTSPLIVPLNGKGSTRIDWDSGSPNVRVQIFERLTEAGVTSKWGHRPLADPAVQGHYTITLRPGDLYEAMMFFADWDVDPNGVRNEIDPLAKVQVFALLDTPSNLITDGALPDQQDVGGTYYARKIATGSVPTWATMQLGRTLPVKDGAGLLQIPVPLFILEAPLATIHDFVATPLDPGNLYFAVVRAHDAAGNWEQQSYAFTTKRQTIKLQWQQLHIINDGVLFGSGFGHFGVYAYEGTSLFGDMLSDIWWRRTAFTTGQNFDIMPDGEIVQSGPRIVKDDNRTIGVYLRGISFRGWPESNEIAESAFGQPGQIQIPFGRGRENVVNRSDTLGTIPKDQSGLTPDFSFSIKVLVNVSYQP